MRQAALDYNVEELAPLADGTIVGTWLKKNGDVRAPVDVERVRRMAEKLRPRLRTVSPA